MAWSGTLATDAECQFKAGANKSGSITEAQRNKLILQAESIINCITRYNWTDAYSTLNADVKYILSAAASDYVGIHMIDYDMSGYSSLEEAQSMICTLRDDLIRCLSLLKDKKRETFMTGA